MTQHSRTVQKVARMGKRHAPQELLRTRFGFVLQLIKELNVSHRSTLVLSRKT